MPPTDTILILGATLRLTRLVTTDDLGAWWVREPAYQAAVRHMARTGQPPWWDKYRAGLSCPHCCGYWIGAGVLATHALAGRTRSWRFVAATLTLNLVAAHLSARLDQEAADDSTSSDTVPHVRDAAS